MAKDAALSQASKTELAEAYSKLKTRQKNAQIAAKREGEALVEDVLTVAAAGGVGYLMGQRHAEAAETAKANGYAEGSAEYADAVAAGGQVAGIDMDLLVGGVGVGAGMLKLGGKMSNTVRKIGIGALASWAGRMGYEKGEDSTLESEE